LSADEVSQLQQLLAEAKAARTSADDKLLQLQQQLTEAQVAPEAAKSESATRLEQNSSLQVNTHGNIRQLSHATV